MRNTQQYSQVMLFAFSAALLIACSDDGGQGGERGTEAGTEHGEPGETESGAESNESESDTDSPEADLPPEPEPEPDPLYDGEPLPAAPPGQWNWVEFPDSRCIDGSPAGIGVRYGISDELVIFFEGGGGCFNGATCGLFYASFANFNQLTFDLLWQGTVLQGGLFSTTNSDNPVRNWNFIYVPYCTGDVHAGDAPDTPVPGFAFGAPQQFVGYRNVHHYLDRIVPTFADASHVLVTGISAGGFGAAFNYDRIADAFPDAAVTLLDDSGPPLTDPYLAPCLQSSWRELFNLDATIPTDCAECFGADGGGIANLAGYLATKHSHQTLGLISSERDLIIRTFFGYGIQSPGGAECPNGIFELPMNGAFFEEGVYTLRDTVLTDSNWGTYLPSGTSHTWVSSLSYYTTSVNGVRMVDWVAHMLEGKTSHVSP
jgi:hypothetical protein